MTSQNKPKLLADMHSGEAVNGFFIIRSIELKSKRDGKPFLSLSVGDASARLPANIWDNADHYYQQFNTGDVVKISGKIGTYKDSPQLTINHIRPVEENDGVNAADFLAQAPIDLDQAFSVVMNKIAQIEHPDLKRLMQAIFQDDKRIDGYKRAPGGKLWHHAYVGGLLEHSLNVLHICESMCELYPMLSRDLITCGALLHDIGKLEEYDFDKGFIDFTDAGRLEGHISLGAQLVKAIIDCLDQEAPFNKDIKQQILHLILSHQGKKEHGSPVEPATPEAMVLYYADEMDSKSNALRRIIERDKAPGKKWSQFIQLLGRYIYLGPDDESEDAQSEIPSAVSQAPVKRIPSEPPGDAAMPTLFD